jgi:hypothetical protein
MAFRELDEFLTAPPIVLPIHGKLYSFPGSISARSMLRLQTLQEQVNRILNEDGLADGEEMVSDEEQKQLEAELFGGLKDEMLDLMNSEQLKTLFGTLISYHLNGLEQAEAVWNSQGEAAAPNRETRRATGSTKSTRSRGSRSGSTTPRKRAAKTAPVGKPSSDTGTS